MLAARPLNVSLKGAGHQPTSAGRGAAARPTAAWRVGPPSSSVAAASSSSSPSSFGDEEQEAEALRRAAAILLSHEAPAARATDSSEEPYEPDLDDLDPLLVLEDAAEVDERGLAAAVAILRKAEAEAAAASGSNGGADGAPPSWSPAEELLSRRASRLLDVLEARPHLDTPSDLEGPAEQHVAFWTVDDGDAIGEEEERSGLLAAVVADGGGDGGPDDDGAALRDLEKQINERWRQYRAALEHVSCTVSVDEEVSRELARLAAEEKATGEAEERALEEEATLRRALALISGGGKLNKAAVAAPAPGDDGNDSGEETVRVGGPLGGLRARRPQQQQPSSRGGGALTAEEERARAERLVAHLAKRRQEQDDTYE